MTSTAPFWLIESALQDDVARETFLVKMMYILLIKRLEMEEHLWCYYLNKRLNNFYLGYYEHQDVAMQSLQISTPWYEILDFVEASISYIYNNTITIYNFFVNYLNTEFKRLNFAYRVIDVNIVEVTSKEEVNKRVHFCSRGSCT